MAVTAETRRELYQRAGGQCECQMRGCAHHMPYGVYLQEASKGTLCSRLKSTNPRWDTTPHNRRRSRVR
jgi:hypothetical protein